MNLVPIIKYSCIESIFMHRSTVFKYEDSIYCNCYVQNNYIVYLFSPCDSNINKGLTTVKWTLKNNHQSIDQFGSYGFHTPHHKSYKHEEWYNDLYSESQYILFFPNKYLKLKNFLEKNFNKLNFTKIYKNPQYNESIEYKLVIKNLVQIYASNI